MDMEYWSKMIWMFCLIGLIHFAGAKNDQNLPTSDGDRNVIITPLIETGFPPSIENGTRDHVIMDCQYLLKNNESKLLEVSWFFNNSPKYADEKDVLIYRWVYGHWSKGQAFDELFRNRLDLNYKASQVPFEMYRAIKIMNPTTELTGKYSCAVSTANGHDRKAQTLIVYSKPKEFDFTQVPSSLSNFINVSCWATGSYPAPKLVVYYASRPNEPLTDIEEETSWIGSAYDVRITKLIDKKDLKESPTRINCDLKIPNTNYLIFKDFQYRGIVSGFDSETDSSWTLSRPTLVQKVAMVLSVLCSITLKL